MDVIDLHCDLLAYLAMSPDRTPSNPAPRCSGPQLKAGNVKIQTLAISSETNIYSLCFGLRQLEIFLELPEKYPEYFSKESIIPAFENASSFCIENEPLEDVFQRLENILTRISPLYIGITWNGENRFGGGCGSTSGLKEEGKELLKFLSGRGIAIDFAHATDSLARETLNYIDAKNLDLRVMASHSNFRTLQSHIRNLPDDIAKEIIQRDGLIGLVFYKKFLGQPVNLYKQIEYGLKLGGENALALGADFFCTEDYSFLLSGEVGFFDEMSNASQYPSILEGIQREMALSQDQLAAIASENAQKFIIYKAIYS
ncbi:MAG: hypothetical protein K940chlam6_01749 [Chlamydiae bacterium]|nr:hypothetical protein [Chlamydiota bacterium]